MSETQESQNSVEKKTWQVSVKEFSDCSVTSSSISKNSHTDMA